MSQLQAIQNLPSLPSLPPLLPTTVSRLARQASLTPPEEQPETHLQRLAREVNESFASRQANRRPSALSSLVQPAQASTITSPVFSQADRRQSPRLDPANPETYETLRPKIDEVVKTSGGTWEKTLDGLGRVLDTVDIPRMAVNKILNLVIGAKSSSPDPSILGGDRVYGADIMKRFGVENGVGQAVGGFIWDVLTDPLTYLTGIGGIIRQAAKVSIGGTTKTLLKSTATEVNKSIADRGAQAGLRQLSVKAKQPLGNLESVVNAAKGTSHEKQMESFVAQFRKTSPSESGPELLLRVNSAEEGIEAVLGAIAKETPDRLAPVFEELVRRGGMERKGLRLSTSPLRDFPGLGRVTKKILPAVETGDLLAPGVIGASPRVVGGALGAMAGNEAGDLYEEGTSGAIVGGILGAAAGPRAGSMLRGSETFAKIRGDLAQKFGFVKGGQLDDYGRYMSRLVSDARRQDIENLPRWIAGKRSDFRSAFENATGMQLTDDQVYRIFTAARETEIQNADAMLDMMAKVLSGADAETSPLFTAEMKGTLSSKITRRGKSDWFAPEMASGDVNYMVIPDADPSRRAAGLGYEAVKAVRDENGKIVRYARDGSGGSLESVEQFVKNHDGTFVHMEYDDAGRLVSPKAKEFFANANTPPSTEISQNAGSISPNPASVAENAGQISQNQASISPKSPDTSLPPRQPTPAQDALAAYVRENYYTLDTRQAFKSKSSMKKTEKVRGTHRNHERKQAMAADAEYQRLVKAARAEKSANSRKEAEWFRNAARDEAQAAIKAGRMTPEVASLVPVHNLDPVTREAIQGMADRLLRFTDSPDTRRALEKIIRDGGKDIGATVEEQKRRLIKILNDGQEWHNQPGGQIFPDEVAGPLLRGEKSAAVGALERELDSIVTAIERASDADMPHLLQVHNDTLRKINAIKLSEHPTQTAVLNVPLPDSKVTREIAVTPQMRDSLLPMPPDSMQWQQIDRTRLMPEMADILDEVRDMFTRRLEAVKSVGVPVKLLDETMIGYVHHELLKSETMLDALRRLISSPAGKKQGFQLKRNIDRTVEEINAVRRAQGSPELFTSDSVWYDTALALGQDRAMGNAMFLHGAARRFGKIVKDGEPVPEGFVRLDRGLESNFFKSLNQFAFEPQVAEYFKAVDRTWKKTGPLLEAYDKMLSTMKGWMLMAPAYHGRNLFSNMFQSMSGNGFSLGGWSHGGKAMLAWRKRTAKFTPPELAKRIEGTVNSATGKPYTYGELMDAAERHGLTDRTFFGEGLDPAISDILAGRRTPGWKNILKDPIKVPPQLNMAFGAMVEDTSKLGHVITRMRAGDNFEQAVASARKYLFDYMDLTPWEKSTMKRLFPFYTWARKNSALQLELLFERPEITAIMPKLKGNIEGSIEDGDIFPHHLRPSYVRKEHGIQLSGGERPSFMNLPNILPFSELKYLTPGGVIRGAMDSLNPMIKAPIEIATNKDTFFDKPLRRFEGERAKWLGVNVPPEVRHLLGPVRPLSEINRITYGIQQGEGPVTIAGRVTGLRTFEANMDREAARYERRVAEEKGAMRARAKIALANGDAGEALRISSLIEQRGFSEDAVKIRIMVAQETGDMDVAAELAMELADMVRRKKDETAARKQMEQLASVM